MTEAQRVEHNRLFDEASNIISKEIQLNERPNLKAPGWLLRRKLNRALKLFERVLQLNPENWAAMLFIGKVQNRLKNRSASLEWIERAYQANPSNRAIALEASTAAMELGRNDDAIAYAFRASQISPQDPALVGHLALAYLLAGRIDQAQTYIAQSLATDPNDTISQTVAAMIRHFAANGEIPPNAIPALEAYWDKAKSR